MFTTNADHTAQQQQHTNETTLNDDNNKGQQTFGLKVMFKNTLYLTRGMGWSQIYFTIFSKTLVNTYNLKYFTFLPVYSLYNWPLYWPKPSFKMCVWLKL